LAKSVCGETRRIHSARVSGPRDRPRRAASATSPDRVPHLLSWSANTSRLGEGRADATTRSDSDGRTRGRVPGSWRITSSLRTTCSLTGTVDRRLDFDVRLRVCGAQPCVGVPRRLKENPVRHGIRSGSIGGIPRRFWRRTPWRDRHVGERRANVAVQRVSLFAWGRVPGVLGEGAERERVAPREHGCRRMGAAGGTGECPR
jgi:hypothetical protein